MRNKIKIIIIDDESLSREITKEYLSAKNNIEIAAECSNGFEAIKKINELKPDLIFLDIQMPKLNRFEVLELLDDHPVIIFTNAYDNFAIKAFEVNAADYLLKPFSEERFNEALQKAFVHLADKEKQKEIIKVKKTLVFLPTSILRNRKLTTLESIIIYLKEKGMKYSEIARLLDRDQRNIWTIYSRAKSKK